MKSNNYANKKIKKINLKDFLKEQYEELIEAIKIELSKIEEINGVVLFGSFARGDYSFRHSDIDIMIFLDETKKNQKLEENILKIVTKLQLGKDLSFHTLFQYRKIEEEDQSLMLTISNEGKVLFAKNTLVISNNLLGLKNYYLIKFDTAKVSALAKNKLQRFLHGYSINKKKYLGIIDEDKVLSAGRGAIIVSEEDLKPVLIFAQKIGVKAIQKAKVYR